MTEQVPRLVDLEAAAIDALLGETTGEERRRLEEFAHSGRFGDVLRGWSGQAAVVRNRFVREVLAHRLEFATGQALVQLADSEYFARLPNEGRAAVGHVGLSRTVVNEESASTGNFTPSLIKAGHKFNIAPDSLANPPVLGAEYEAIEAVPVNGLDTSTAPLGGGEFEHVQEIVVPVRATRVGPHANTPRYDGGETTARSADLPTSTPAFVVGSLVAAGGTLGPVDAQLKALARAMSLGRVGPTNAAAIAGALSNLGVRHAAYFTDYTAAVGRLFIGDESWASSAEFERATKQELFAQTWIGFGCRVATAPILNTRVVVAATLVLRSAEYENAKAAITQEVLKKLRAYFDDRPDFWTFDVDTIGGLLASADRRILTCTGVEVQDADRAPLTAPAAAIPDGAESITHFALVGDALDLTFQLPS